MIRMYKKVLLLNVLVLGCQYGNAYADKNQQESAENVQVFVLKESKRNFPEDGLRRRMSAANVSVMRKYWEALKAYKAYQAQKKQGAKKADEQHAAPPKPVLKWQDHGEQEGNPS